MAKEQVKIVVIGGGAGGMMAAIAASENNAQVILIEKNKRLGKKILISGKGRCNVTNAKEITEIINNFPGNGKFLYGPLYAFSNQDLMIFLESLGVKLKVERGERVFPVSDNSGDIVNALENKLRSENVQIIKGSSVNEIIVDNNKISGVILDDQSIVSADKIVLATGGVSYPGTGSTGDGYRWAEELGHSIKPICPSLIPLVTEEGWIKEIQGLSLKNVAVELKTQHGKKLSSGFGEMLFTHFGVSGPVVLTLSRDAVNFWQKNLEPLIISVDLKPALSKEQLDNRLQREIDKYSNKQIKNSLGDLLPKKLIPIIIKLSKIDQEKVMNQITKEERQTLNNVLKGMELTAIRSRPLNEAIVTAGGINVKEVNPQTMESKKINGLYFAGEVLDIDGLTGGYNLQAAFSTGFVAGVSAALTK